jgi:hypothetical protein
VSGEKVRPLVSVGRERPQRQTFRDTNVESGRLVRPADAGVRVDASYAAVDLLFQGGANATRDLQRSQREFREDLNLRRNEELASVQDRANKVIQQIAEAEKFDLIVQEPVIYASPRIDITDKVIKALADK